MNARGERRAWLGLAALLLAVGFVLCFRVGVPPLASRAEERCASVVETMVATGDWLVPVHHGVPRLQKPPLFYWEASALGTLAGATTLTTLRLPSAAAALGLLVVVFLWGRHARDASTGLMAACALAVMQSMHAQGRIGTAEMNLSLFSNLALFTYVRMTRRQPGGSLPLFALWLALAILAKATVALLAVGLPIAIDLTWRRAWPRVRSRRVALWLLAGAAAGFLWYPIVILAVPGGWSRIEGELVLPMGVRTEGAQGSSLHYGPVWEYFGTILSAAFPAVLALPLVVMRAARSRFWGDDPVMRFSGVVLASLFVAFSLIPAKQKHYLLPLLPSLALLIADSISQLALRPERLRPLLLALAAPAAACGVGAALIIPFFFGDVLGAGRALVSTAVVGAVLLAAAIAHAAWNRRLPRVVGLATAGALLSAFVWYGSVDIWLRQFENGSVVYRPDYVAARWESAFQRSPFLARHFRLGTRDY